ncbi:hypothetical protein EFY79_00110 [Hanamia caeni]|jgi:hypothetical protein|uniref:Uncharacterized protein n=1 Tax=Hanamia caeni TaxID=2294116 RepID=A0A3M9NRT2_9BACT|nr:hypothetical protein [Hanamia caeni]RNI39748.1 hypothetical protein EFY79_00110 [Hanamia caeni]
MKKYSILILILSFTVSVNAQDFAKDIADAKSSYSAGKLADAHFSLEQAIQEIDMIVGKEVLKLLPAKMNDQASVEKDDQVTANVGFVGATVHRSYGDTTGSQVEIISNSPLIASLNSFLNMPLVGGMMRNSTTKVVKIQGYKSRLEKQGDNANGKPNYQLQIPFKSALITITVNGMDENAVMSFANSIPLDKIAALIQ